jgi:hypothetical protein
VTVVFEQFLGYEGGYSYCNTGEQKIQDELPEEDNLYSSLNIIGVVKGSRLTFA